jgi:hypothetical protein
MLPEGAWRRLPDASEGLGDRLYRCAACESLQALYREASTRRYPEARIRRMVMCAFLGIRAGLAAEGLEMLYARVLAAGLRGRDIINRIKGGIPVITKPARGKGNPLFELGARATDLYALGYPGAHNRRGGGEWTRSPWVEGDGGP